MTDDDSVKTTLTTMVRFMYLGIMITAVVFFAYMFSVDAMETTSIEMSAFTNRLLYSKNAISYYDAEIDRTYLGVIDLNKFNTTNVEKSINYFKDQYFAANLTLQGKKSVMYHEELYKELQPLGDAGVGGAGGVDKYVKDYIIKYKDGEELKRGTLRIRIYRSRS